MRWLTPWRPYFYPRPLRGGRLVVRDAALQHIFISIHALCEEGDHIVADLRQFIAISIHALCEEGDPLISRTVSTPRKFLSTPSARRATFAEHNNRDRQHISIHALCEEGDAWRTGRRGPCRTFLSTPSARRATCCRWHLRPRFLISIHALCEEGDVLAAAALVFTG